MKLDNNTKAFFALIRDGLWGVGKPDIRINETADWHYIYQLAQEQTIQSVALQGIEELRAKGVELSVPKVLLLQWIGEVRMIEQRNKDMNAYIAELVEKLRKEDINAVLVKGQGVAQCYERPLWRVNGDVDFLLDSKGYEKAKKFLEKRSSFIEPEEYVSKHIGFNIDSWLVELHGHMYFGLLPSAYKVVLEVEEEILHRGGVRSWNNNGVEICFPSPDNDIIIVFVHFLGHFCFGGIGLRQLCDLGRLLWTYKEQIDLKLLGERLNKMGLMSEWKVFASALVDWLGMPPEAMPFYDASKTYTCRAKRAIERILRSGTENQNIAEACQINGSKWEKSSLTLLRRFREYMGLVKIFPLDAHRFFINYLIDKVRISRARSREQK